MGIDNITAPVASASTITLPVNPIVLLSGTTTINTIAGSWGNRVVRLIAQSGLTLANGARGVCNNTVMPLGGAATLTWNVGLNCWLVG
jgi:hypothetical protein